MKTRWQWISMTFTMLMLMAGCGGSDGDGPADPGGTPRTPDLVFSVRIDDSTGFINLMDGAVDTRVTNDEGTEINTRFGIFSNNGYIFTTGSTYDDKIAKYEVTEDNRLAKVAETTVSEAGGTFPSCFIFADDIKAYVILPGTGELIAVDQRDLSITNRIDLSAWAVDANGNFGGDDTNPEPSSGVIRDGKLYLSLAQIDSFSTYHCRGMASVLIIDVASDEVLKHISDDRTCTAGLLSPNNGLVLDENGDIYVNCLASFGYYPGLDAGVLRINSGEDQFDPDYYFSLTGLTGLDVPGGVARYAWEGAYLDNGRWYTALFIPGLTSNPPDYVNDRNYVPYELDLWNQTATKLDMEPTNGWSNRPIQYANGIIYPLSTTNGTGFFHANESTPFVTTDGDPYWVVNIE